MKNRETFKQEIIERNLYFASNFFGMGLEESEDYTNIKTTIQYNFNLKYVDKINKEKVDEYVLKLNLIIQRIIKYYVKYQH